MRELLIFFMLLSLAGQTQEAHPILRDLIAVQRAETVYLQWTIKEGQTCNDIHIERSENGINFKRIGLISRVCGSSDADVVYTYTDSIPLPNQVNYYRLELGTQGFTEVVSIKTLITGRREYIILQNPITNQLKLFFEEGSVKVFHIYNLSGVAMLEKELGGKEALIEVGFLSAGMYVFTAQSENSTISGKFVVTK